MLRGRPQKSSADDSFVSFVLMTLIGICFFPIFLIWLLLRKED